MEKLDRYYGPQPKLPKWEIELSVVFKINCSSRKRVWEACPQLDLLLLAFVYARRSMEIAKMSGFGIKNCLAEASLGWTCFGTYNKTRTFYALKG